MRIGHGFDVHRFGEGDHIILGGVRIDHDAGLMAHSDGDVLVHALCDALLGAISAGDIGRHFPDTDPVNANIDSRVLLRRVWQMVGKRGLDLVNADITIIAQAPRMAPHIDDMCAHLAQDLGLDPGDSLPRLNIKATTTEGLGYAGRREGIAVHAVVLLCPRN